MNGKWVEMGIIGIKGPLRSHMDAYYSLSLLKYIHIHKKEI